MTEICEGVAIAPPEQAEEKKEEKEKQPVKIRIALFFDGTLNNRTNIEAREDNDKHYLDNQEAGNSFENGRTNIAIMETHMAKDLPCGYEVYKHFYIPGQGTFDLKADNWKGFIFGAGKSGVVGRAKLGVQKALSAITGMDNSEFDPEINFLEEVTIDVFGFSRGAATARYAIHLLLKDKNNLYQRVKSQGYDIDKEAVKVGFAGLYDTVLSYMASQKFKSARNFLQQTAHKEAEMVLHLASAEEHRKDFPVHNISCAKKGEEYYLPGVHSDIGGSYNQADETKISAEKDETKKRKLMVIPTEEGMSEKLTINQGSIEAIEADKAWLKAQGWYKSVNNNKTDAENMRETKAKVEELAKSGHHKVTIEDGEFTTTIYFRPRRHHSKSRSKLRLAYATLSVKRSGILSGYSNIPLKIMAEYVKNEPKLVIKPKMEERANTVIDICELTDLESVIKKYIGGKPTKSHPNDWLEDGELNTELKKYRHKHFNFSSRRGIGFSPRFVDGLRKRFIYDA